MSCHVMSCHLISSLLSFLISVYVFVFHFQSTVYAYIPDAIKSDISCLTPALLIKLESFAMKKIMSEEQDILQEETDIDANELDMND
jgi:hypothetical protein